MPPSPARPTSGGARRTPRDGFRPRVAEGFDHGARRRLGAAQDPAGDDGARPGSPCRGQEERTKAAGIVTSDAVAGSATTTTPALASDFRSCIEG